MNRAVVGALPNVAGFKLLIVARANSRETFTAALVRQRFVNEIVTACGVAFSSLDFDVRLATGFAGAFVKRAWIVSARPRFVDRQ